MYYVDVATEGTKKIYGDDELYFAREFYYLFEALEFVARVMREEDGKKWKVSIEDEKGKRCFYAESLDK